MDGPRDCHTGRSESDGEGKILYGIPYMWNVKRKDTTELTKKKKKNRKRLTDLEKNLWCQEGRDHSGVWDGHVHTAIFKIYNQ